MWIVYWILGDENKPLTLLVSAASFPDSSNEGFCCNQGNRD